MAIVSHHVRHEANGRICTTVSFQSIPFILCTIRMCVNNTGPSFSRLPTWARAQILFLVRHTVDLMSIFFLADPSPPPENSVSSQISQPSYLSTLGTFHIHTFFSHLFLPCNANFFLLHIGIPVPLLQYVTSSRVFPCLIIHGTYYCPVGSHLVH